MKKIFLNFIGGFLLISHTSASFAASQSSPKEILQDIKEETKKCAVQIVNTGAQAENVVGYTSACTSLKIVSMGVAQIFVDGQWFTAQIAESQQSDDGDLDDLYIYSSNGQLVAKRTNIPAFDSVIIAMAGTSNLRRK
ncbi:MAG: hypothetical protein ACXVCY_15160 [Pseudobdellovibrionaceae bacterium]